MYSVNLYGDNSKIIRVSLNHQILLCIGRTYKQAQYLLRPKTLKVKDFLLFNTSSSGNFLLLQQED